MTVVEAPRAPGDPLHSLIRRIRMRARHMAAIPHMAAHSTKHAATWHSFAPEGFVPEACTRARTHVCNNEHTCLRPPAPCTRTGRGKACWATISCVSSTMADTCNICQQPLVNAKSLANLEGCTHSFCLHCISGHVTGSLTCPTCGKPFSEIYELDQDGEHRQTIKYQTGCRTPENGKSR